MARVPRRLEGERIVQLNPEEEHLLQSVDGSLNEEELAFVTGLSGEAVSDTLDQLALLGLVTFGEPAGEAAPSVEEAPADDIVLSVEERAHIDGWLERVQEQDYYRLLGVDRDATKDEVKAAYYRVGPKFHPDNYYGRNIGAYKLKVEKIFGALTRAHDTLRYKKRRDAYDAALPPLKVGDRIPRRDRATSAPEQDRSHHARPSSAPSRSSDPGRSSVPGRSSHPDRSSRVTPGSSVPSSGPRSTAPPDRSSERGHSRTSSPPTSSGPRDEAQSARARVRPSEPRGPRASRPGSAPSAEGRDSQRPSAGPSQRPSRGSSQRPSAGSSQAARRSRAPRLDDPSARRAEREALARKLGARRPSSGTNPKIPARPVTEVRSSQRVPSQPDGLEKSAAEKLRDRYSTLGSAARERRQKKFIQNARYAAQKGEYAQAAAFFAQALALAPDDAALAAEARRAAELAEG